MSGDGRQRVDVWLFRARFAKTRAAASRLVAEGGVRIRRGGRVWRLQKASAELAPGDALVFARTGGLAMIEVLALAGRRGTVADARALYRAL